MKYYVLQVMTGEEKKFRDLAKVNFRLELPEVDVENSLIWPRRKLTIRKNGINRETLAPIFPGYLFFMGEKLSPEVYWLLRRTPEFVRFLKSNQNIEPLEGSDKDLLMHFLNFGEIVEKSKVWFDENKKIRVLSGPMKGLEGRIIKVDRRKKRAKISLSLYRESFTIDFGFEILGKVE
ncbi:MAG: antiterminator LoaP [Spirochaetales bacterium]|nr:antiterminator LoaP [Spirochaetales bacterium]